MVTSLYIFMHCAWVATPFEHIHSNPRFIFLTLPFAFQYIGKLGAFLLSQFLIRHELCLSCIYIDRASAKLFTLSPLLREHLSQISWRDGRKKKLSIRVCIFFVFPSSSYTRASRSAARLLV